MSEINYEEMLNSTLEELVTAIFDDSWVGLPIDDQTEALETFRATVKFVEALRKQFDDVLTVENAKGNLENVEHIRKPYEKKDDKPSSMADLLKKLTK